MQANVATAIVWHVFMSSLATHEHMQERTQTSSLPRHRTLVHLPETSALVIAA
jgi:hypothetical protein